MWPLFLLGLAVSGLLVGLMLGRLMAPGDVQLLAVQATANGLELYFDREAQVLAQDVEGAYALLIQAQGDAQQGALSLAGGDVKWRVMPSARGLLVYLVATRPLPAQWQGIEEAHRWRLVISLPRNKRGDSPVLPEPGAPETGVPGQ